MSSDAVNHPAHYTSHPSGEECITFAEWLGFNVGDAFKYVWRQNDKGDRAENLRKAIWYLARAIEFPATIPHRRPSELPESLHAAWLRVTDSDRGSQSLHALMCMWDCQFDADPVRNATRARRSVAAVLESIGASA